MIWKGVLWDEIRKVNKNYKMLESEKTDADILYENVWSKSHAGFCCVSLC